MKVSELKGYRTYMDLNRLNTICFAAGSTKNNIRKYSMIFDYLFLCDNHRKGSLIVYIKWKDYMVKNMSPIFSTQLKIPHVESLLVNVNDDLIDFIENDLVNCFDYATLRMNIAFLIEYLQAYSEQDWCRYVYLIVDDIKKSYDIEIIVDNYLNDKYKKEYKAFMLEKALEK